MRRSALLAAIAGGWMLHVVTAAGAAERPQVAAVYFAQPPVLDGDLSDPCWQQAPKITDLKEIQTGGAPKEPTTFWLGCDDRYLYWAAYAKDSQPGKIRADQKKRGGDLWNDDIVELDLDTYQSHKEAYWFVFNACGTQYEDIPQGSAEKTEWRGDWEVATRRVSDGWTGEARIPLAILRYPAGARGFGVMLARRLARESEFYVWPYVGGWDYEKAADWGPLKLPRPRPRITTMVHAVPEWREGSTRLSLGLDAKCLMPSGMEGQLTVNPDFEDVAQEVQGIDFTYTERHLSDARPFFTEGRGFYPPDYAFYTRRLADVDVGLKWFGRMGEYRLGVLDAWTPGQRHTMVGNWVWDYRPYSQVSALAVVDDNEGECSSEYGAGISMGQKVGQRGNKSLGLSGYTTTAPGEPGSRQRWSASADYDSGGGHFGCWAGYQSVDAGFAPAVAYFPESGYRGWSAGLRRSDDYRTGRLRGRYLSASLSHHDNLDGSTYDHNCWATGYLAWRSNWALNLSHSGTLRPPYDDRVEDLYLSWNTDDMYRGGSASLTIGRRQGGDYRYASLSQGFRLSERWAIQTGGSWVSHDAPTGHYADRLLTLSGNCEFDPEHSVSLRLVDSTRGSNAYLAYRQKVRKGMDLYVILGDPNADETTERVAAKSVWAF
jgi:hypothetical protein